MPERDDHSACSVMFSSSGGEGKASEFVTMWKGVFNHNIAAFHAVFESPAEL